MNVILFFIFVFYFLVCDIFPLNLGDIWQTRVASPLRAGVTRFPHNMNVKKGSEELMMHLPAIGKNSAVWVSCTRIDHFYWDHTPVYSQFADLRVRSVFTENAKLVWTEKFGKELNPIVDEIKTMKARQDFVSSKAKKVKKGSAEHKRFVKILKPLTKKVEQFNKALKRLK